MAANNRQEALRQINRSDIFCTKEISSVSANNSFYERTNTPNFKNKSDIFNIDQSYSEHRNSCIKTSSVHNRSSVNLGNDKNDSYIIKKSKFSKTEYNPDKYYNNVSVYERKIREFYPDSDKYEDLNRSIQTARGTLKKEIFEDSMKKRSDLGDEGLTARERKFKQNNSSFSKEEVKKILSENKVNDLKSVSNSQVANGSSSLSIDKADSKTLKREFLKSNIFHDPGKKEIYEKFQKMENSVIIEKENRKNSTPPKTTIPLNPWQAKIDWINPKNELIFHNDYKEFNKDESCSPLLRKIKNLQNHADNQELNDFTINFVPNTQDPNEVIVCEDREQIKSSLQDKMESQLKVRRSLELSSIAQGKDFYKENMKLFNKIDRPVSSYEVKDIKDFENLKVKEVKNMFAKNGIHIYDVKPSGSYANGNKNGSLSFKIRENNDDASFLEKVDQITKDMKSKMGLDVQPMEKKILKKPVPSFPLNVRWDNPQLSGYVRSKGDVFVKSNFENDNKPAVYEKQKLSQSVKFDKSYKNNNGVNKYIKK